MNAEAYEPADNRYNQAVSHRKVQLKPIVVQSHFLQKASVTSNINVSIHLGQIRVVLASYQHQVHMPPYPFCSWYFPKMCFGSWHFLVIAISLPS